MASRFWVGGTGNWDASDTTHWSATSGGGSGASVPTSSDDVTFDANSGGGTVTLTATANCLSITAGAFTGTLNTNGQTVNVGGIFSISGSGVRTITLGSSTINISGSNSSWGATTITNLTFNSNTSTINITTNSANAFTSGGLTYNNVVITYSGSTSTAVQGANTFSNLTLAGGSVKTAHYGLISNQTISGTLTISGNSSVNRVLIGSLTPGSSRTLTAAVVVASNADFQDITGAGAGSWNLSAITGNSGDCGGNSGITFTTPADQHWTNVNGGSWSSSGNWTSRVPLPQDDVYMDCAFGASKTVTNDMPRAGKNINFTGATWTTALTFSTSLTTTIFGSLTLLSGMSYTASGSGIIYSGRGSFTITTNGVTLGTTNIDAPGGTYSLGSNFSTGSVTVTRGTLSCVNGASNYTITGLNISVLTTATLRLGSGTHELSSALTPFSCSTTGNITADTSTIKFVNTGNFALTFAGGGKTYHNLWISRGSSTNSVTISGSNTFNDLKDDGTAAHSLIFSASATNTFASFTVSGSSGNLITLTSTSSTDFNFVKAGGGIISCDYLDIQNCDATPATTWYAGANSVDNQGATGGTGWIFTVPPAGGTSNFLAFMI